MCEHHEAQLPASTLQKLRLERNLKTERKPTDPPHHKCPDFRAAFFPTMHLLLQMRTLRTHLLKIPATLYIRKGSKILHGRLGVIHHVVSPRIVPIVVPCHCITSCSKSFASGRVSTWINRSSSYTLLHSQMHPNALRPPNHAHILEAGALETVD